MHAKVRLELNNHIGELIASRQAKNAVMRAGGELIAKLFAGQGAAITHMGVGTDDAPESETFNTAQLTNEMAGDTPGLSGLTEVALPPEAFHLIPDETQRIIKVRVRGTLPANAAVGTVREAGLLSKSGGSTILYNRVTFAPIIKADDHELTMFWEITFPYGDLQWF